MKSTICFTFVIGLTVFAAAETLNARESKIDKARYKDAFWAVLANLELLRVDCSERTCSARANSYLKQVKSHFATIDQRFPGHQLLEEQLKILSDAVERSSPLEVVSFTLQWERLLMGQLDAVPLPAESLDFEMGRSRYAEHCASCHGANGNGDGRLSSRLNHALKPFASPFRTTTMTPLSVYAVMVSGSSGTEMTPFVEALSQEEMWNVAFYVSTLPYINIDEPINEDCKKRMSSTFDLNHLMTTTDSELTIEAAKIPSCSIKPAYLRRVATFDPNTARELNGEIAARGSKSARGLVLLSLAIAFVSAGFIWVLTRRSRVK